MRAINPLIPRIKSKLPILEAAQRYGNVTPKKKGNTYWCSCLQKQERTPSMQIFPDRDYYRCFSCHAYGDQIDLVAEAMNIPLSEAIQMLAKDLGIEGDLSQEERDRLEQKRQERVRAIQKKQEQENTIRAEYNRLCDIERLMYSFLLGIKSEADLDRFEVICSLRAKDLLDDWLNTLLYGTLAEKLNVVEQSREWNPWR